MSFLTVSLMRVFAFCLTCYCVFSCVTLFMCHVLGVIFYSVEAGADM